MVTPTTTTVTRGARGLWPIIRRILSINFFAIILVLILVYSIIISVQQGSFEPMVNGVGGRAFFALNELNEDSMRVLSPEFEVLTMWRKFVLLASIAGSFMFIFIWVRVLSGLVARTVFGGDISRWLANWSVGLAFFILLEMIFVLVAGYGGFLGDGFEPSQAFTLPWDAVKNFISVIPVIIEPIINFWDGLFERGIDIIGGNNTLEGNYSSVD